MDCKPFASHTVAVADGDAYSIVRPLQSVAWWNYEAVVGQGKTKLCKKGGTARKLGGVGVLAMSFHVELQVKDLQCFTNHRL